MESNNLWKGTPDVSSFDSLLELNKNIDLNQFQETHKTPSYVESVNYDATKALFYDQFIDFSLRPDADAEKMVNVKLKKEEVELFVKNGFVVREALCHYGAFADEYLKIFNNDLPVYVTADSVLHALSSSYEIVINMIETHYFSITLENMLVGMLGNLRNLYAELDEKGPLRTCCNHADVFLTTALSLLTGEVKKTQLTISNTEITPLVQAVLKHTKEEIVFCGKQRSVDFAKFRPTSRYEHSDLLQKYFRAMMWLSLDFELGGVQLNTEELGTALVMHLLLTAVPKKEAPTQETEKTDLDSLFAETETPSDEQKEEISFETLWTNFNSFLESLVGFSNCVNFLQLGNILQSVLKFKNANSINNTDSVKALHQALVENESLKKQYNSNHADADSRAFAFMGRRFTIDNWATSKLTGETIRMSGQTRRRTSGVDVAFSVLGNNATVPILSSRINDTSANNFRDGVQIQAHLATVREVINKLPENVWQTSLYMNWLDVLRSLSEPLDERAPQATKTKAYAFKQLNAQLGNWAQLRHDNTLYVDEESDEDMGCSFPDSYVEPIPKFWASMESLTQRLADTISHVPFPELKKPINRRYYSDEPKVTQQQMVTFFNNFSTTMTKLKDISVAQLLSTELTADQITFLKSLVKSCEVYCGLGEVDGWYYDLYFYPSFAPMTPDMKVTGVFSAKPMEEYNDPGSVLHVGVESHRLMLICVERPNGVTAFAGPVYSYKEFETPYSIRLQDSEWLPVARCVPTPEWTHIYQVNNIPEDSYMTQIERIKQKVSRPAREEVYVPYSTSGLSDESEEDMGFSLFD